MKTHSLYCAVVSAFLAVSTHAQMIPSSDATTARLGSDAALGVDARPRFETKRIPGTFTGQPVANVSCDLPEDQNMLVALDPATLGTRQPSVAAATGDEVFNNPSPFRRILVSASGGQGGIPSRNLEKGLAAVSAAYRVSDEAEKSGECGELYLSVIKKIEQDRSKVLEIVAEEIEANNSCACEIVKAAIKATEADVDTVVAIVEAAINAAPEHMRIISQCAIAANPDAIAAIQALLAKLDPNSGREGYSSKGAKSGKDMIAPADPPEPFDPLQRIFVPDVPPFLPPPSAVTSMDRPRSHNH